MNFSLPKISRNIMHIALVFFFWTISPVSASLVFVTEGNEINSNNFIINADDSSSDFVDLEFGSSLGVSLSYDILNDFFRLNRDLDLAGNQLLNTRIENLAENPACAAVSTGRIYFNTTENVSYICDGTDWKQINASGSEMPAIQIRRSTNYTTTNAFVDISFDITDVENVNSVIEHNNTNTDNIDIKEEGIYMITYRTTLDQTTGNNLVRGFGQVRLNDASIIPGSQAEIDVWYQSASILQASSLVSLSAGDFITLQLRKENSADPIISLGGATFSIIKLEGIRGEKGDPGSGGPTINEESFIIDNDNTGGDVALVFGQALNESLIWDAINTRFNLSDDLRVDGNLATSGQLFQEGLTFTLDSDNVSIGANVEIIANQGADNNGVIRYNAASNVWEVSNDGGAFIELSPATANDSLFFAYDAAGGTSINNTVTDIPFDTKVRENTDFSHAINTAEVTINTTGNYLIGYNCTMDAFGTARYTVNHWIQRNTGSGFVEIPGTRTGTYHRTTGDGLDNGNIQTYANLDAGDSIKISAQADSAGVIQTVANGCRLKIQRIDTANGLIGPAGPQGIPGQAGTNGVSGGGWGDDGVTTTTALDAQIDGDLNIDGNLTVGNECGPYGIFWAERGTIASNEAWAFGNGQTPWGSPMGCAGRVTRFAATCTALAGTSLGAVIRRNNVETSCSLNVSTTLGQATTVSCNESFGANDVVGIYAQTEVGSWSECVGTFWVKYD